jgi:hypothetical protein
MYPPFLKSLEGSWSGPSRLNLMGKVTEEPSTLEVEIHGKVAVVEYTWHYEAEEQKGAMVIAGSEQEVTIGWADSWHQSDAVMVFKGPASGDKSFHATGNYTIPEYSDWSWRIAIEAPDAGELILRMTNITPDKKEEWAVEGVYRRA